MLNTSKQFLRSSKRRHLLPMESQQVPEHVSIASLQQRRPSLHRCTACDASFYTLMSLQQHGKQAEIKDACREAVEYGLEP